MKQLPDHIHQPISPTSADNTTGEDHIISTDNEQFIQMIMIKDPAKGCELLFRRYHKILCNHAIRFVYSKEIAEDIVSEVFCRLWKSRAYETIKSSYRFYLLRCVRNEAYNYLKSEFHKINRAELSDTLESSAVLRPDHIAYLEEITSRIQYIIERLPLQCRKVFLLSRYEGKKYQSIAEELNISIKTVEAHISKALSSLRQGLKEYWME
ncbi:MAG: RNA polymerase sigma-70 factor [Saprospiraceae bacterium]|nr:RNA polymerase sigma-70 factor [Saprospiraceae bacterium]MBK7437562.1 RNA polymerase sigma-70 factor [Saprospiraceae bacterium]MBK8512407.1 RNA polymerase sigma-70 factor [Saprospiraceae bacterium]